VPSRETLEGSDIALERTPAGLRIVVPPSGLKAGRGIWPLGVFLLSFTLLFNSLFLFGRLGQDADLSDLVPNLFMSCFMLAGLGLSAAGWNVGQRSASLELDEDALVVTRYSPFGAQRVRLTREVLGDIRVAPSGVEINGQPVRELQIHAGGKKVVGLLSQRKERELEWIATNLRGALTDPAPPDSTTEAS
jgi:hypothetical protein